MNDYIDNPFNLENLEEILESIGKTLLDSRKLTMVADLNIAYFETQLCITRSLSDLNEQQIVLLIAVRDKLNELNRLHQNTHVLSPSAKKSYNKLYREIQTYFKKLIYRDCGVDAYNDLLRSKFMSAIKLAANFGRIDLYGHAPQLFNFQGEDNLEYNGEEILQKLLDVPNTIMKFKDLITIVDDVLMYSNCTITTISADIGHKTKKQNVSKNAGDLEVNIFLICLANIYERYLTPGKRPGSSYNAYTEDVCSKWTRFANQCLQIMKIACTSEESIAYRWKQLKNYTVTKYIESLIERKFLSKWGVMDPDSIPLHDYLENL